ncbi:MAG: response regulator [Desulfobacterales bacterium]|nr:MAG: response regulator [Desulfobacterales bacterium]
MKKEVLVLDPDERQSQNLCGMLTANEYTPIAMKSLVDMRRYIEENDCHAIILNLDMVTVTNKGFKEFKRKNPLLNIIALSERQFHPELEEAFREYISVCLAKPLDTDDLVYWLKTIFENDQTGCG